MKYLKIFEKLLHFDDPKVINNPLFNFSKKLEEVLLKIKELDSTENINVIKEKAKVRKYFSIYGSIELKYSDNAELFNFKILQYGDDVILTTSYGSRTNNIDNNSIFFFDFIKKELSNYIDSHYNYAKCYESYRFPMTELDNIIEKFEKFKEHIELKISANKYNI